MRNGHYESGSQLNLLRLQTYGTYSDDDALSHQTSIATTPWAQTDNEFQFSMDYIRTGQVPDDAAFRRFVLTREEKTVLDDITSSASKSFWKYLEAGAAIYGGRIVGNLLKLKGGTVGGYVFDKVKDMILSKMRDLERSDVKARFLTDETRRVYLATKGLSSYKSIS